MLNNDVNMMLTDAKSKDDAKLMLKHDAKAWCLREGNWC